MDFVKSLMNIFKNKIFQYTGRYYIPEEIQNSDEKIILHISDTPNCIYPFLIKLIDNLKPDIIVHSGDLVDNVKLGTGAPLNKYKKYLFPLINKLESVNATTYIIPGNHDFQDIIEQMTNKVKILKEGSILKIEGIDIGIAHFLENLPRQTRVNLYGHNKRILTQKNKLYLNGLLNINILLLPSLNTFHVSYPAKTEIERKYRRLKLP